jgi:signal transduction histidine kinase
MQGFDRREEFKMEYRLRRHDGEYRWVLDIGVPRFALDRAFTGYIGVAVDVTDRKVAEEALAGVSRRLIEAQEQERARIARELHDDANQRLAALVMNIEQLRDDLPEQAVELRGRMDQLREHTLELSNDIRTLAHELHPPGMEFLGLAGAARGFCHEFGLQQKIAIDLTIRDVPSNLPFDISLCLFRVMQEALHNSAKHSAARKVTVELWGDPDGIRLTVSDAWAGFELQKTVGKSRGLGLTSMQERVKLQNGTFAIESQPNRGTRIHVSVPFSANAVPMRATG